MVIYRVQDVYGYGPYNSGNLDWQTRNHDSKQTPHLELDILLKYKARYNHYAYLYGFKSMDQLNSWFTKKELINLKLSGYKIVKLDIPDNKVIVGYKQVMFLKRGARHSRRLYINTEE